MSDRALPPDVRIAHDQQHDVRAVQRRMALAMLPPLPPEHLGDVTLLPHQRQGAARLERIIARRGGALLADAVGLGKTYTALAVARRYTTLRVLAPAGLVPMWQAALLRIGRPETVVHSLHRASLRPLPFLAEPWNGHDTEHTRDTLVIIDEAHALRNPATSRYRHVAVAVSGCDVLLLTATPLHNAPSDLRALVALFGEHGTDPRDLGTLVVRREHPESGGRRATAVPRVRRHTPITIPQQRHILDMILALPVPLPAREGTMAGALVRLGLLRAWCSSDAALTHAITKRLLRGSAMRDALDAGRHLSNDELRSWLIDEEGATDMQLGFPELLSNHSVHVDEQHTALRLLDRHCEALRALRETHVAQTHADDVRAAYLRAIRKRHHDTPVVVFSQHARTVQALFRALADIAGVGMLTGSQARVASGTVKRAELLGWFAPRAQGRPPPPPTQRVTMLLTTDLIAEGVNLQDASVIVHIDLPWTQAVRTQRTGRVARIGSLHHTVHEYRFRGIAQVREVLAAERRLVRKALLAAHWVGDRASAAGSATHRARRSTVVHTQQWQQRLLEWATVEHTRRTTGATSVPIPVPHRWRHQILGSIVLVRTPHDTQLLALMRDGGRWRVTTRPAVLLSLADAPEERGATMSSPTTDSGTRWLNRLVRRWWTRQRVRQLVGAAPLDQGEWRREHGEQRRARAWLRETIGGMSAVQRFQQRESLRSTAQIIERATGAGARHALQRWVMQRSVAGDIDGWRQMPELVALAGDRPPQTTRADDDVPPTIEAILLVFPPEAAP